MKYKILLVALSAALVTGCSTAYRAGQTPDDVYFSPGRDVEAREEVRKETRNDDRYETYTSSEEDNYLRMRIRNRNRWSSIDDFDYWYNPYNSPYYSYSPYGYRAYGNSLYYNYNGPTWNRWGYNGFNNYGWRSNYNYYGHGVFGNYNGSFYPPMYIIKNTVPANNVSRPSLGSYRNGNYNNNNTRRPLGETLNKVFSPSQPSGGYNNSNNNSYSNSRSSSSTYEAPSRSYNPPASTSSSSSSSAASSSSSSSSSSSGSTRPPR